MAGPSPRTHGPAWLCAVTQTLGGSPATPDAHLPPALGLCTPQVSRPPTHILSHPPSRKDPPRQVSLGCPQFPVPTLLSAGH